MYGSKINFSIIDPLGKTMMNIEEGNDVEEEEIRKYV